MVILRPLIISVGKYILLTNIFRPKGKKIIVDLAHVDKIYFNIYGFLFIKLNGK
jgi:hypothetical protein